MTQATVTEPPYSAGEVQVSLSGSLIDFTKTASRYHRVPLILNFSDILPEHSDIVGGKGASLGRLARIFPDNTKPGIVVTTAMYETFLKETGLRRIIRNTLAKINFVSQRSLQVNSALIRWHIKTTEFPAWMREELEAALESIDPNTPKAVRSSMKSEDGAKDSFAGQQATFLNVVGTDNIIDAIRECWASLFEARAVFYRATNGYNHLREAMAVPVMDMVQADSAGTFFTVDPNHPEYSLIEAGFGLGEAIVSGEEDPEEVQVHRETGEIKVTPSTQKRKIIRFPQSDGKPTHKKTWVRIPKAEQGLRKIGDDTVHELVHGGNVMEGHYGCHVDCEWAVENGKLYYLQARPITSIDDEVVELELVQEPVPLALHGKDAAPGVGYGRVVHVRTIRDLAKVKKGDVIVSPMTNPDFVSAMKLASAIVTERGGRTCHAAVVSREFGIPCIVGATGALAKFAQGAYITVDGSHGDIFIGKAETRLEWGEAYKRRYDKYVALETMTKLMVNLAEPERDIILRTADLPVAGIGLLRAEFIVAHGKKHPGLMKREEYKRLLKEGIVSFLQPFNPRPVVYRFTDFKTNEYRNLKGGEKREPHEDDPMIGYRGASRYITEPELFEIEIEVIRELREEGYTNLWAMVPFVRTPEELEDVKDIMEDNGLVRSETFKLWMMVEIPSNVIILDKFIEVGIDGVSIGSNDLTQLVLGVGRNNEKVAYIFNEMSHAVMRSMKHVVTKCRAAGLTVSVCGQGPSVYPELAARLVDWGVTSLSVSPDAVGKTKLFVHRAEQRKLAAARA